ncbi:Ser/Thr protein phosphatase [Tritrichomonas foetus]|uniref:Ser/Thr protein phosphatase n=1 Tax=Tritrichomonas foetus TaxID=1144522 RepID=A0A1J4K505_9EUKA|nr:Ser/Thr protein phosphatase [Tritrichomonas foetus]|eukprot:OHT04758.1 Ser/Thr protein phosphatase [Tritrichomonas foetus]
MKYFAYFISQYLWICILFVFLYFPFYLTYNQKVKITKSRDPPIPFDESLVPDYFAHLSDIHINHKYEEQIHTFKTALSRTESLNPMLAFVTGDLADDFTKDKHPNYGTQSREDHEIYHNLTQKYNKSKFFDMAGNHDEYGVLGFTSDGNNYNRFHQESYDDFQLKIINFTLRNNRKVHFFILNPYNFPAAHPPLLFWPSPSKKFLDRIEDALDTIPDHDEIIFLNHYPVDLYICFKKSKKGRDFKQITKTIRYSISGHNHPQFPIFNHHDGKLLEIVGSDLKTHKRMGIFTFDNDRFVYHYFNHTDPNFLFVTNPVPTEQLSEQQIFNELGTPIRCLVFVNKSTNDIKSLNEQNVPKLEISGAINDTMKCVNVTNFKGNLINDYESSFDMFLCSAKNDLPTGTHRIHISGTFSKTIDFTLGNSVPEFVEEVYDHARIAQFPVCLFICLIIGIIIYFPIPKATKSSYIQWLTEDPTNTTTTHTSINNLDHSENKNKLKSNIIVTICGFVAIRFRIQQLPIWIRYLLFFFVIYSLFGPISFMEIEGKIAYIWIYGYICDCKNVYALWGQMYTSFYLICSMLPVTCIAATLAMPNKFQWFLITDILGAIGCAYTTGYVIYRYLSESVDMKFSLLSPGFIFIPILLYFVLFIWKAVSCLKHKSGYDNVNYINAKSLL